jgi:hypothetical protein
MIPTKEEIIKIDRRIEALNKALVSRLCSLPSYTGAEIDKKIECRIMQAEIEALKELKFGGDLEKLLKWCVDNEQYSGAEGIRRVLAGKEHCR